MKPPIASVAPFFSKCQRCLSRTIREAVWRATNDARRRILRTDVTAVPHIFVDAAYASAYPTRIESPSRRPSHPSPVFRFFDLCTSRHKGLATGTTIGAGRDMTSSLPLRIVRVVSVPVFLVMMAAPTSAQEEMGFAKNGGYVGMSGILDFSFGGDTFDGESIYKKVNGEEILILPKFEGAQNALRAVFGWRTGIGAFEVSYDRSKHQGTFLEFPGEATFHALNFDER